MTKKEIRILKEGTCKSLSGRSTLTYKIGRKDKELYLCLTDNTGTGIFNKKPVELSRIDSMLAEHPGPITSSCLRDLFAGKSSNSAGFILAVLLAEGLLKVSDDNQRHYDRVDQAEVEKVIQALMKSGKNREKKEVAK